MSSLDSSSAVEVSIGQSLEEDGQSSQPSQQESQCSPGSCLIDLGPVDERSGGNEETKTCEVKKCDGKFEEVWLLSKEPFEFDDGGSDFKLVDISSSDSSFDADSFAVPNPPPPKEVVEDWVFPHHASPTTKDMEKFGNGDLAACNDPDLLSHMTQYLVHKFLNLKVFGKDEGGDFKTSKGDREKEEELVFNPLISPIPYLSTKEGMAAVVGGDWDSTTKAPVCDIIGGVSFTKGADRDTSPESTSSSQGATKTTVDAGSVSGDSIETESVASSTGSSVAAVGKTSSLHGGKADVQKSKLSKLPKLAPKSVPRQPKTSSTVAPPKGAALPDSKPSLLPQPSRQQKRKGMLQRPTALSRKTLAGDNAATKAASRKSVIAGPLAPRNPAKLKVAKPVGQVSQIARRKGPVGAVAMGDVKSKVVVKKPSLLPKKVAAELAAVSDPQMQSTPIRAVSAPILPHAVGQERESNKTTDVIASETRREANKTITKDVDQIIPKSSLPFVDNDAGLTPSTKPAPPTSTTTRGELPPCGATQDFMHTPSNHEIICRGKTHTKEHAPPTFVLGLEGGVAVKKVEGEGEEGQSALPPPITPIPLNDQGRLNLKECEVSRVRVGGVPAGDVVTTPYGRVGRRSLIPTPCGATRRESTGAGNSTAALIQMRAAFNEEMMKDSGATPTLEEDKPQVIGTKGVEEKKRQSVQQVQRKAVGAPKKLVLKPRVKGGLQQPSTTRLVSRGVENSGVGGVKGTSKVPVAAVRQRGNVGRRGPFRPINGAVRREQESQPVKSVYSSYNLDQDMLAPRPKVMHSPIDKENLPSSPHSKWSPIRKKRVNLDDSCFRCTKRV